jgi:hypothetical protein
VTAPESPLPHRDRPMPDTAGSVDSGPDRACLCDSDDAWTLLLDETRTIRRYRVWACRKCHRHVWQEDAT